jgi:molybdopterin-synthase adenylyltransferase
VNVLTLYEDAASALDMAFGATPQETVAFGFAGRLRTKARTGLLVDHVELVPEAGYRRRQPYAFSLEPRYVAEIALKAAASGRSLVLFHSHPGSGPTDFSAVDERMHATLIRSLLREIEGPVGSVVRTATHWNGRLWEVADQPQQLDLLRIVGAHLRVISIGCHETEASSPETWDRQIRAFGPEAQAALGMVRLGIVGTGGTGSLAAQWAAHLGIGEIVLVDPDQLEESNRSRVVGSTPEDVGGAKVEIASRTIRSSAPDVQVETVRGDVVDCEVLRRLAACDLMLGCTDSHASRAVLNALAYQYAVPLIDIATVLRGEQGTVRGAYADVRLATPGQACLRCQEVIDSDRVGDEMLPSGERKLLERFGYTPGVRQPAPSVLPLNALAVSLAFLRVFDLVVPWLEWEPRVTINARDLSVLQRSASPKADCDVCSERLTWGRADDVPLPCRGPIKA